MRRLLLALLLVLGWALPAAANHTVIHTAATNLAVGQFVQIPTMTGWNNGDILFPAGCGAGNPITQFANTAVWNPLTRRLQFSGSPHAACSGTNEKAVRYDDDTNTWSALPTPPGGGNDPRHSYAHNAMNPATGEHYYTHYNSTILVRLNSAGTSWTTLAPRSRNSQCCRAQAWFPDYLGGRLIHYDGDEGGQAYNPAANSWARLWWGNEGGSGFPVFAGAAHSVYAGYSARCQCVLIAGLSQFRKMNSDGTFTALSMSGMPGGTPVGPGNTNWVVDPVSGMLLTISQGGTMRQFDPGTTNAATGSWTTLSVSVPSFIVGPGGGDPADSTAESLIAAPNSTYGVVMYVKHNDSATGQMFLYKHAASIPAADQDFLNRCQGATRTTSGTGGVLRCFGFDAAADIPTTGTPEKNWGFDFGIMVSGGNDPTIDTGTKSSGSGAMRMQHTVGGGSASGGSWFSHFGPNKTGQQGSGGRIFVQFRVRWTPDMVNYALFPGGGGAKIMDISLGDTPACNPNSPNSTDCPTSCPNQGFEFVLQDNGNFGIPSVYANCNGTAAFTALAGGSGGSIEYQNMIGSGCQYPTWNVPPCKGWLTNQWMTFKIELSLDGGWNAWGSDVRVWYGGEGQPLTKIIDCSQEQPIKCTRDFAQAANGWFFVNSAPATYNMGKVYLHPYRTCQVSPCNNWGSTNTIAWYDELIISTQDIADPGVGGPPIPTPPAAPSNLRLVP